MTPDEAQAIIIAEAEEYLIEKEERVEDMKSHDQEAADHLAQECKDLRTALDTLKYVVVLDGDLHDGSATLTLTESDT